MNALRFAGFMFALTMLKVTNLDPAKKVYLQFKH